jgi:hypothetical protein
MWRLTWLVTILFALPPLTRFTLVMVGLPDTEFAFLGEATFTTLLTLIWGSYLMSDYHTKKLQNGGADLISSSTEIKESIPKEDD